MEERQLGEGQMAEHQSEALCESRRGTRLDERHRMGKRLGESRWGARMEEGSRMGKGRLGIRRQLELDVRSNLGGCQMERHLNQVRPMEQRLLVWLLYAWLPTYVGESVFQFREVSLSVPQIFLRRGTLALLMALLLRMGLPKERRQLVCLVVHQLGQLHSQRLRLGLVLDLIERLQCSRELQ